jgi:hypothetical protein
VANVSDGISERVSTPPGITQFRQFIFALDSETGTPIFKCRFNTHGNEMFRGIRVSTGFTSCFDPSLPAEEQRIDFTGIPPAQRPDHLPSVELIAEYTKTILAAHEQWDLTSAQINNLVDCVEVLTSEDPIPFHWYDDDLFLQPRVNDEEIDDNSDGSSDEDKQENFFNPDEASQLAESRRGTMLPYEPLQIVMVRSPAETKREKEIDPFWLALITTDQTNPPHWTDVEGATETDFLVKIHWYDRRNKKNKNWKDGMWDPQWLPTGKGVPCCDWVCKESFCMNLPTGLSRADRIYVKDHKHIKYFLQENATNPMFSLPAQ